MSGTNMSMAEPLYRLIAEDLREKIESGELAPGAQILTEAQLREQYHASRNTIRDALRWLTARGLINARAGQGTFVVERIFPFVVTLSERESVQVADTDAERFPMVDEPRVEVQKATGHMADMLRLHEGD